MDMLGARMRFLPQVVLDLASSKSVEEKIRKEKSGRGDARHEFFAYEFEDIVPDSRGW